MGKGLRSLTAMAALVVGASAWTPAAACSVIPEFVRPSNFELVQISDAIVIARVSAVRPGEDLKIITFDVEDRVKGEAPVQVELEGALGKPSPSDQNNIGSSHPEGHAGPCNRMTFRKGGRYLLFLEKDEGTKLRQAGYPFSRINEDYAGEETVWMRTVRRYVRLQSTAAPIEQIASLERLADSRRGLAGEALQSAEIEDIRDHLGSLSPYKPTPYLLAALSGLEKGLMPRRGVRPRSADREQSDADAIAQLALGTPPGDADPGDLEAMRLQLLTALVTGDHPDALPVFDRLAAEVPEDPDRIGLALRFFARNGAYGRAFQWIETRLMKRLAELDPLAAHRLIGHVADLQSVGGEGGEPWRSDPRAAALWPELALSLYWYQVRTFGADRTVRFTDALRTLPHGDYRARPLLTLALAAGFATGVAEWAVLELKDEAKRKAWEALLEETRATQVDPAALPLQILLSAWHYKYSPGVDQVSCQSEKRGLLLIRTLGEVGDSLFSDLIQKIAASALSEEERAALPGAIEQWGRRNDRSWPYEGRAAGFLASFREGKRTAAPIPCRARKRS